MNCEECRDHLAHLVDSPNNSLDIRQHLAECPACRQEAETALALHQRLERAAKSTSAPSLNFTDNVMSEIENHETLIRRRSMMWKRLNWSLATAAALLAIVLWLVLGSATASVQAAELLQDAADVARVSPNLHITGRIRSGPAENPGSIDLNAPFVKLEIWKHLTDTSAVQWRIEKPQRVIVMDGAATYTYISVNKVAFKFRPVPDGGGDAGWLRGLLQMGDLLDNEVANAKEKGHQAAVTDETGPDGRKVSVVTIDAKAPAATDQNAAGLEWLKNKTFLTSDTKRVYRFDAQTHQFEGFQVFVHAAADKDVLVFETTAIEYPAQIAESAFAIELPAGIAWQDIAQPVAPEDIPEACKPEKKPEEVARAFFEALSAGDQKSFDSFWRIKMNMPPEFLATFKNLKIQSIGTPESAFNNQLFFVPYKIQLTSGEIKEFKLNVRCDNPAHRWYVDGGF
jgi:hypothetical protein